MTIAILEKLRDEGWYLSDHGYKLVSESGNIHDIPKIIKRALDFDLREISSGQEDASPGNVVMQIQKIRNVAAPKSNEESRTAPRLLKLSLTDGKNNLQAIEVEHISSLSLSTPPGTKILIRQGNILSVAHGIVLLKPSDIQQVLGGRVTNLVEKWELNRKLALHTRVRSTEEGGPPLWIPFGKEIAKLTDKDNNFKALAEKEKVTKENAEFDAQRKDAIAEAAKQGCKKVFGGGNKQLLDHTVQKIVDHGFTIEQAEYALRVNRNNVEKALKSLQKSDNKHKEPREPRESRGKKFDKKTEEIKPSSGKISLFDFLEDKLPVQPEVAETQSTLQICNNQYNDSLYRLEAKNANAQSGRGGRAQRNGRGYQVPPRHSEDNKSSKRSNGNNSVAPQYSHYNGGSNPQQNKPPRFQRNQDTHNYYQQNHIGKGSYQRPVLFVEHGCSFIQTCANNGNNCNGVSNVYNQYQQQQPGKNVANSKNYTQIDIADSRNKHIYNGSSGRHNRAQQDGHTKIYTASAANDKICKNEQAQYEPIAPNDDSSNKEVVRQSNEDHHGITQNLGAFDAGTWMWQVGDKCLAKYWEDNRYYNAVVTAVSDRTCVVQFKGFENFEEVLQIDCLPITEDDQSIRGHEAETRGQDTHLNDKPSHCNQSYNCVSETGLTTVMEFRRTTNPTGSGSKNYKKRGQQRSSQPIYQPPAQRNYNRIPTNTQRNMQN